MCLSTARHLVLATLVTLNVWRVSFVSSAIPSLPKCGKGKPALVRRNTVDDKSELIACIETGNFAKAARIAAGNLTTQVEMKHMREWVWVIDFYKHSIS